MCIRDSFSRIQFTPDLLPADVVGTQLYNVKQSKFSVKKGPVFANFVLADEINRTPPKTQAALLEAMQEKNVTVNGKSYQLPTPFFVLATQNPIEQEGTYPLPEAQLDRFMFNLEIEYPSSKEEISIVRGTTSSNKTNLNAVITKSEISLLQDLIKRVPSSDNVVEYAVKLSASTRPQSELAPDFIKKTVDWGAGPRASQYLVLGAKAKAVLIGRPSPNISYVKSLAAPIHSHRVLPNFNAEADGLKVENIIDQLIDHLKE